MPALAQAAIPATGVLAGCPGSLSQPFTPWLDFSSYGLAPGGGFETGATGWTLAGGAGVVVGNEPWHVTASSDAHALSLPSGAIATTPSICVATLYPTLRLFERNVRAGIGGLNVDVLYTSPLDGRQQQARVLTLGGGSSAWAPTLPAAFLVNLTAGLHGSGTAQVRFRFTAVGGAVAIDDLYIDPYKAG